MGDTTWAAAPHLTAPARAGGPGLLQGERLRAYRAAVRHSRLVRLLRIAIPAGAALAVAAVVGWTMLRPAAIPGEVELGPVALDGTKVTMERPRLSGFRKDGKPYEVNALAASQDVRKPGVVELEQIRGRLGAEGDGAVRLTAATGVYDMKSEQLQLDGGVRVRTENGDTAELKAASINLKQGELVSTDPVRIVTASGDTIDARTMRVRDSGKAISFEGGVKTVLYPPAEQQGGAQGAASQPAPAVPASSRTDTGLKQ